jgi:hypothetical protein
MRRILAAAVLCAGLTGLAAPAQADLSRMSAESTDSFAKKTDIAVGELFDLRLKVGVFPGLCTYTLKIEAPSGSGYADQTFQVEVVDPSHYRYKLPNGWGGDYEFPGLDPVVYGVPLLTPGRFEIQASSANPSCRIKAPPLSINVRPDYSPMTISIYGRPGQSLVRRLDGSWTLAPGEKFLWMSERAAADLRLMADSYIPGAWAQIFPAAFANAWSGAGVQLKGVTERAWVSDKEPPLSDAGETDDDRLLVLALGREAAWVEEDVRAGRLVKVVEFSPEVMIQPLREGARGLAEAERARSVKAETNRSRLGDPATIVGLRIGPPPGQARPAPAPQNTVR